MQRTKNISVSPIVLFFSFTSIRVKILSIELDDWYDGPDEYSVFVVEWDKGYGIRVRSGLLWKLKWWWRDATQFDGLRFDFDCDLHSRGNPYRLYWLERKGEQ